MIPMKCMPWRPESPWNDGIARNNKRNSLRKTEILKIRNGSIMKAVQVQLSSLNQGTTAVCAGPLSSTRVHKLQQMKQSYSSRVCSFRVAVLISVSKNLDKKSLKNRQTRLGQPSARRSSARNALSTRCIKI